MLDGSWLAGCLHARVCLLANLAKELHTQHVKIRHDATRVIDTLTDSKSQGGIHSTSRPARGSTLVLHAKLTLVAMCNLFNIYEWH
jgi:hypothetical protein